MNLNSGLINRGFRRSLPILCAGVLTSIAAQADDSFTENFNSYTSGTILYSPSWFAAWPGSADPSVFATNSNLAPVANGTYGTATIYQDNGGTGTTPDVTLFPGTSVATFANLNFVDLATTHSYTGLYEVNLTASLQDANPQNPFGDAGVGAMELHLRLSSGDADDGVSIRIFNNGTLAAWEGPISGDPFYLTTTSGVTADSPFDLLAVDNGSTIQLWVDGNLLTSLNTSYGDNNAGYISFGTGNDGYIGAKIDSVSVGAAPEPQTWALLLTGVGLLIFLRHRRVKI